LKGYPEHFRPGVRWRKARVGKLRAQMKERSGAEREESTWVSSQLHLVPAGLSKDCAKAKCGWDL